MHFRAACLSGARTDWLAHLRHVLIRLGRHCLVHDAKAGAGDCL